MYDEKYLEDGKALEIKTVEDALSALIGIAMCGSCDDCPAKMYSIKGTCNDVGDKARKLLRDNGVGFDVSDRDEILAHICRNYIVPKAPVVVREEVSDRAPKTCSSCDFSEMHPSGIRWCHNFGNLVHEDGFCYRHRPVIMDGDAL